MDTRSELRNVKRTRTVRAKCGGSGMIRGHCGGEKGDVLLEVSSRSV